MDSDVQRRINAIEGRLAVIEAQLGIARGVMLADGRMAPQPSAAVLAAMQNGKTLQAITAYRAESGCDLDEARQVLEALAPR
jgi:hypothetical protein